MNDANDNASDGKSFECKTKITEKTEPKSAQSGNYGDAN